MRKLVLQVQSEWVASPYSRSMLLPDVRSLRFASAILLVACTALSGCGSSNAPAPGSAGADTAAAGSAMSLGGSGSGAAGSSGSNAGADAGGSAGTSGSNGGTDAGGATGSAGSSTAGGMAAIAGMGNAGASGSLGGAGSSAGGSGGAGLGGSSGEGSGRLQPSANGRYLQWSNGTPVFLLSDTAWLLPGKYSLAEVTAHAKTRAAQGFTAIQMTASFPENGHQPIETVFTAGDFTKPVATYWSALDAKVKQCTDAGLIVILSPFWKKTSDAAIASNGTTKCRAYGKWLATRYRDNPRVGYFLGGDAIPGTVRAELNAMGLGIQDAYTESSLPPAIVAYHGAPGHSSREEWPEKPSWLTLDWTYAYSLPLGAGSPYQENWSEWPKAPPMPIMFGEGWYDRDNGATTTSRFANRAMVRRQLWWNPLSGALAGVAYGAEPIWLETYNGYTPAQAVLWNSGLDAARLKKFLDTVAWWRLVPDLNHTFITAGNGTVGAVDYAVGAVAEDNSYAVAYTPAAHDLTLKMPAGKSYILRWFDPSNGTYRAGSVAGASAASVVMAHPGNNASGAPDWVIHVSQP